MRVGNTGGTNGETPCSRTSPTWKPAGAVAATAANIYPGLGTPAQVFSALTGLFSTGTMTAATYASTRGQRVSDLVKSDLDALKRFDMSSDDMNKLNAWEALINDVGTVISSSQCSSATATTLEATQA